MRIPRVLVVEDDPSLRSLLQTLLVSEGYEVAVAADGLAGLVAASAHRPALVLLDVLMPDLSGARVLEEMQADPELADVPVIVLSGKTDVLTELSVVVGAANVFAKPFAVRALLRRISEVTGGPIQPGRPIRLPD